MGLATYLQERGLPYDSQEAIEEARRIVGIIRDAAYRASIALAEERGSFPSFEPSLCVGDERLRGLPETLKSAIEARGLRNRSLLSITSERDCARLFGVVSPGIEPVMALRWTEAPDPGVAMGASPRCYDAGFLEHCRREGLEPETVDLAALGPAWATARQLPPESQLALQAALQGLLDMPLDSAITLHRATDGFGLQALFQSAHALGCWRCALRRPRGR